MSRVAAIQMASGPNLSANLLEAGRLLAVAAEGGAQLAVLPENFALMGMREQDKVKIRESDGQGAVQEFLAEQARRHGIWLVGTAPLVAEHEGKVRMACLVYDDRGRLQARYDKIHLFDVRLTESGEKYTESETLEAGDRIVVVDTPVGRLGLAVCYDLRFPELFRRLTAEGAEVFALPAAFTAITGRAHWEVLVRARAIENLCYMVASAQGGFHANGRETHGDSMIVDPWGVVVDRLPRGSGVVFGDIDLNRVSEIRRSFPALSHRRFSCSE